MIPWGLVLAAGAMGLGLTLSAIPAFLAGMRALGWGQPIRSEGPAAHQIKAGTPTMGGVVLLGAALLATCWWPEPSSELALFRAVCVGCGLLGLADDLTKVLCRRNLGFRARHKLLGQVAVGLGVGWYLVSTLPDPGVDFPLLGFVAGAGWVWLFSVVVTTGTVNAVNLTDGLDGLAAGCCAFACAAYVPVAAAGGCPELSVAAAAVAGACLGFLWFNCYPARLFMGDTGAMGLGGALAALALLTRTEFLLVVIGGVFVAEALSVLLQVACFQVTRRLTGTGRRIFRMSPLHHHFGEGGMHEAQITVRFWLVGAVLGALGAWWGLGGLSR